MPAADSQFGLQALYFDQAVLLYRIRLLLLQLANPKPGALASAQGVCPAGIRFWKPAATNGARSGFPFELLEVTHRVVSDVADFTDDSVGEFALDTEVPLLRVRIVKILGNSNWLANPGSPVAPTASGKVRAGFPVTAAGRQNHRSTKHRSRQRRQIHGRGGSGFVQEHVIEGWIIGDSETAADHSFVFSEKPLSDTGSRQSRPRG